MQEQSKIKGITSIKSKYIFKKDYNPVYINGAQGGISPSGEVVINFYLQRNALPVSQTFDINEDGVMGDETAVEPKDLKTSFVRVIENGIVMNYQTAKEIHRWLGNHIDTLENNSIQISEESE